jgi:hypothetical protein
MREDEVEALLKIDSAGLRVHKTYAGYEAEIFYPALRIELRGNFTSLQNSVTFTGFSPQRQGAIANAWQKYQQFMSTEAGRAHLNDHDGQLMFRM